MSSEDRHSSVFAPTLRVLATLFAAFSSVSRAADTMASKAVWSGAYFGAETSPGGLFGKYDVGVRGLGSSFQAITSGYGASRNDTPILAGGLAGYNLQFGDVVLGLEGSFSAFALRRFASDYVDEIGLQDIAPNAAFLRFRTTAVGTFRARMGYALQNILIYGTGGVALARTTVTNNAAFVLGAAVLQRGFTVGGGVEAKLSDRWSVGVEYRYAQYQGAHAPISGPPLDALPIFGRLSLATHQTSVRMTYFPTASGTQVEGFDRRKLEDWSLHGQSTFISQGVPSFRNPYSGQNSLLPNQVRQTWSNTFYAGRRLWEGGEAYVNPEINQGFGLSGANGLAGLANGEATKAGFREPHFRLQRYFVRQTFGFGGEQEDVDDGQNTIAGKRDIDRLTVTAGKFGINDIFDDNKYSHDPRLHFFNLSLWEAAAYDFPANLAGYTQGLALDLNRKDWAVRAGVFQVPKQPNSDSLDYRIPRVGGGVIEFEGRFSLFDQAGKIRVGLYRNRGRTGSNREAVWLANANPTLNADDAIVLTRRDRLKSGIYINAEQAITDSIGLFARISRNDGRNEILSFTDADFSAAGGLRVMGNLWGRSGDVVGIGAAINGLSRSKATFLAVGGNGLLIGDGTLRYRPEQLAEAYYAAKLAENVTLTIDGQFIAHPGHNADRGPVPIVGARLHFEF